MGKRPLNLPFLGLQALLILIDCIAVAYVSPILVSFGYSPMRIGRVMTLAALAATLARPVWGYLNDHFACARQVTLLATAAGISCYCLLVFGGDARPAVTAVAVMGLNVTIVCMMNFVDAWALRLISEGYVLKYGATRDYVRSMTVVLPSGEVVKFGSSVSKTSSGYSLLNLMIGSEGTLGIITELTLKLIPAPKVTVSLIVPYESLPDAIATVPPFKNCPFYTSDAAF